MVISVEFMKIWKKITSDAYGDDPQDAKDKS